jgi:class 3 adenylate cyclase
LAGLNFEFLHPHYPKWNNYGLAYPGYAGLMALLFSWQFLSIRKNAPQMQKFLIGIAIAYVIGIACVYLNLETYSSIIIRIGGLMIPIVLIASAIIVYKKGYKPAQYYLLAWGSFLISIIIYLLITFDAVPQNEFTGSAMEIGSAIEIILLSIALGDKINFYKDENEKAQLHALNIQRKANEELEMKVMERTEEIVKINEEVMAQRDDIERQKDLLEIEKNKSDKLLLNILPSETAKELKDHGFTNPKYYEQVTVMFTDFKQFTNIAEELTPQQIIFELDKCFLAFDDICEKYNLERIKTIGDAYMAGGGIPIVNKTNAVDTVRAALEIQQFLTEFNKEKEENGSRVWQVRIGIHTGAVVAGVVGKKKFAYDIWGDAVNVASRMESCGEIGKVNISGQTYELIKDQFTCTYRGKVFAKNKGEVDMYFVES